DYLTATLILLIATSGIGCEWLWSPLPGTRTGGTLQLQPGFPGIAYLNQLAVSIPQNASVSATAKIEPHFSEREHIYPFPQGIGLADYILVEVGDPGEILSQPQIIQAVDDLSHNPAYRQIYRNGPVSVFKRR
ncbi:DUF2079 domain-containing protein, partial [Patescibacteria group bacterium]|nr:DUF2079 domain-containing protein [Patescibacteria group bacterium]